MSRFTLVLVCLFSLFSSFAVQAEEVSTVTTVEKRVIVTPAPKATCTMVAAHWENNVWIEAYNVCKYENRAEGVEWIDAHWSCTTATADGTCTAWEFVQGRWVKTAN